MTLRSYIAALTICFCLTNSFHCFGQSHGRTTKRKNINSITFDTSKTAIIIFSLKRNTLFDSSYKPAVAVQTDLDIVDSLLAVFATDYNKSLEKDHEKYRIDLKGYRKQLIFVTDKRGHKQVWVNCFCSGSWGDWKTEIQSVVDGGKCYFNFKIDLATRELYDLMINGLA